VPTAPADVDDDAAASGKEIRDEQPAGIKGAQQVDVNDFFYLGGWRGLQGAVAAGYAGIVDPDIDSAELFHTPLE